jgi:hypothetical protein
VLVHILLLGLLHVHNVLLEHIALPLGRPLLQRVYLVLLESILLPDQLAVHRVQPAHLNPIRDIHIATHVQLELIQRLVLHLAPHVLLGLIQSLVPRVARRVLLAPIRLLGPQLVLHAGLDLTILHQDRRPVHLALQALTL